MAAAALEYFDHGNAHFGHTNDHRWCVKKSDNNYEDWLSKRINAGFSKNRSSDQGEAIKALGPLFKQTQVHLWDEINPPLLRKPCTGGENIDTTTIGSRNGSGGGCPSRNNPVNSINRSGGSGADISRYWKQRYLLFSKFDEGIKMDVESWFSVTPEAIAKHHATRCGGGTIIDCFSGVGGNVIQFALTSKKVIAIEIDPLKFHYAKENAAIYGVDSRRIHFVLGDSMALAPRLKGDVVFLSPPWGGPDYLKQKRFDINTILKPRSGQFLFNLARRMAPRVVMFLPRNVNINQLAELALSASPPWTLEVEKNYLNGKLKAITAYFSETKYCNK